MLYSLLRRVYNQYFKTYSGQVFVVFANVSVKKAYQLPIYYNNNGAYNQATPDGYLPMNLSPYYFKERPVFFQRTDQDVLNYFITNKSISLSYFQPVIIFNLFFDGQYRDVYVNYNPDVMDVQLYIKDASVFSDSSSAISSLQNILNQNIKNIQGAYNQCVLLLANPRYNDNDGFVKYYKTYLENEIARYQANPNYIVKVCTDCAGAATIQINGTATVNLVVMAGALSLYFITSNRNAYSDMLNYQQAFLANTQPDLEELAKRYKTLGVNTVQPDYTTTTTGGITTLPGVTVGPLSSKWWILALLFGAGYVLSGNKRKQNK